MGLTLFARSPGILLLRGTCVIQIPPLLPDEPPSADIAGLPTHIHRDFSTFPSSFCWPEWEIPVGTLPSVITVSVVLPPLWSVLAESCRPILSDSLIQ